MHPAVPPGIAMAVALLLALVAAGLRTLTPRGALVAAAIGTLVLVGGGWSGGLVLVTFFVTSSAIPRLLPWPTAMPDLVEGPRRARQVLANGGPAALGAAMGLWHPALGLWLLTGGLASAAADTWATEVGQRLGGAPRNLVTGKMVQAGVSGGVTAVGTIAGILGAGTIAAVGSLGAGGGRPAILLALAGTVAGTLGMLMDSLLGATWQACYRCPTCGLTCEAPVCRCGAGTELVRGFRWFDNDWVNAFSTVLATAASALLFWLG